jgi:hypothetical protein
MARTVERDQKLTPRDLANLIEAVADPTIEHTKRVDAALSVFRAGASDARVTALVPLIRTLLGKIDKCRPAM